MPVKKARVLQDPKFPCGQCRNQWCCGDAHLRTQPRWGWLVPRRWTQGSSLLATLGFVVESLWDSPNSSGRYHRPNSESSWRAKQFYTEENHLPRSRLNLSSVLCNLLIINPEVF